MDRGTTYAEMGMAALLPGMIHMYELMQKHLDDFRQQLSDLQNGILPTKRRGRPPGSTNKNSKTPPPPPTRTSSTSKFASPPITKPKRASSGWPTDPEERKAEAMRRRAVTAAKKAGTASASKLRKSDAEHPDHEKWRKNVAKAAKKRWDNMPAAERKRRLAAMVAGRRPNGKLEHAAS
jgi:hypothetical protein